MVKVKIGMVTVIRPNLDNSCEHKFLTEASDISLDMSCDSFNTFVQLLSLLSSSKGCTRACLTI